MIKYNYTTDYLHLFLNNNKNLPYLIAISDLGTIYDRDFIPGIYFPNLSRWVIHILKNKNLNKEQLLSVIEIIKLKTIDSMIDWEQTIRAIDIYEKYSELSDEGRNGISTSTRIFADMENRIKHRNEVIAKVKIIFNLN